MAKFFVVSDVHSFFDELMQALEKAKFDINDKNHIFVCCGDLLDRGPDPESCLKFVNSLPDDRKILIKGNHELLLEQAAQRGYFKAHDYHNRTVETAKILAKCLTDDYDDAEVLHKAINNPLWEEYSRSFVNYYEDNKSIFVHGWIPSKLNYKTQLHQYDSNWRQSRDWHGAVWANGMQHWLEGIREPGKTIYCGHFHASWGHHYIHDDGPEWDEYFSEILGGPIAKFTPFEDEGICCLDACTAYSEFVNCKVISKCKKPIKENYHR